MDQVYKVTMASQTIIADSEMITIRAATAYSSRASVLAIIRMSCGQTSTTTSAQLSVRWGLKASAFGTFTSTTPAPTAIGSVASAITGSTTNAASSSGTDSSSNGAGTLTVLGQEAFNNLNGWLWVPTPEERIIVGPDLTFVLQLQGTPSALSGWSADLTFMELN
jgi:tripartite-type tricarboxylate transporter receptor subunit TctC